MIVDEVLTEDRTEAAGSGVINTGNGRMVLHRVDFCGGLSENEMPSSVVVKRIGATRTDVAKYGNLTAATNTIAELTRLFKLHEELRAVSDEHFEFATRSLERAEREVKRLKRLWLVRIANRINIFVRGY